MIGRRLSHFRILDRIGEGGMGVVYRAEDEKLQRVVALKVLPPEKLADEERRLEPAGEHESDHFRWLPGSVLEHTQNGY
jgi:serine/threonine protein kinase